MHINYAVITYIPKKNVNVIASQPASLSIVFVISFYDLVEFHNNAAVNQSIKVVMVV